MFSDFLQFFKNFFLGIFFVFVNFEPYGSENFKTPLLQIEAKGFQTFPEFSSQWFSQNRVSGFEILKNKILMNL